VAIVKGIEKVKNKKRKGFSLTLFKKIWCKSEKFGKTLLLKKNLPVPP